MDSRAIARLAVKGSAALMARQVMTGAVTFGGGVLLARLLSPAEFGGYALIVFVAALSKLLIDGGLAATLVQQNHEPSAVERSTVFTVQSLISVVTFGAIQLIIPLATSHFAEVSRFGLAMRIASVSVLGAPVSSVCLAMLERALRFGQVSALLTIQPVVFNALAVFLSFRGWGVVGLGVALTASTLVVVPFAAAGAGALPRFGYSRQALDGRFRFGIPFIGTGVVSALKDAVNPILIGILFGAIAVGYINWAQQVAVMGTYVLFALSRLLFPLFARLRTDAPALRRALIQSLFWCNAVVAPIALFTCSFASDVTRIVFGVQWLPAVPTLLLLSISNVLSPTMVVLMALMNALGKAKIPLFYAMAWFAGSWILVPWLSSGLGYVGYGWANVGVNLLGIPLVFTSRSYVPLRSYASTFRPWLYALIGIGVVVVGVRLIGVEQSLWTLILSGMIGVLISSCFLILLSKPLVHEMRRVLEDVRA